MSQMPEYQRGYRDATRDAVTWLYARAREMNDPHAKQILDCAADSLGVEFARKREAALSNTFKKEG